MIAMLLARAVVQKSRIEANTKSCLLKTDADSDDDNEDEDGVDEE